MAIPYRSMENEGYASEVDISQPELPSKNVTTAEECPQHNTKSSGGWVSRRMLIIGLIIAMSLLAVVTIVQQQSIRELRILYQDATDVISVNQGAAKKNKAAIAENENATAGIQKILKSNGEAIVANTAEVEKVEMLAQRLDYIRSGYRMGTDKKFYKEYRDQKTWKAAKSWCERDSAHLAMITSEATHKYITRTYPHGKIWIGATDSEREGAWKWLDGTSVGAGFTNWGKGEPNNHYYEHPENCMHTNELSAGYWNDHLCSLKHIFLCQKG